MGTSLRHSFAPVERLLRREEQRGDSAPRAFQMNGGPCFTRARLAGKPSSSRVRTSFGAQTQSSRLVGCSPRGQGLSNFGCREMHSDPSAALQAQATDEAMAEDFYMSEDFARMPFLERLARAWKILFPPSKRSSNAAEVAKERLRLVLYTDRGEVSPEVRSKLRKHIIEAISLYVEIEDEEEVQLYVAADPALGAVYSVTIPVRRVKPEFQEYWSDVGFRDRFYEEILREQGMDSSQVAVQTTILEPGQR